MENLTPVYIMLGIILVAIIVFGVWILANQYDIDEKLTKSYSMLSNLSIEKERPTFEPEFIKEDRTNISAQYPYITTKNYVRESLITIKKFSDSHVGGLISVQEKDDKEDISSIIKWIELHLRSSLISNDAITQSLSNLSVEYKGKPKQCKKAIKQFNKTIDILSRNYNYEVDILTNKLRKL